MDNFPNHTIDTDFILPVRDNTHDNTMMVGRLVLAYVNDEGNFGELRVYHPKWDATELEYIYDLAASSKWIAELRVQLLQFGFTEFELKSLDFSESGMQGRYYVSLDVNSGRGINAGCGKAFIEKFVSMVK